MIFLASCAPERNPVTISFQASWNGATLDCESPGFSLSDLRFYVSEVALHDRNGTRHPVALLLDDHWQDHQVSLIDLEDGTGECENGSKEMNAALRGTVEEGDYQRLSFTVGVPFELNHADPLTAAAPLGEGAMHWHWRSGYKFMRAGVHSSQHSFWLHLGSSACEGTSRNISRCEAPNRVLVDLPIQSLDGLSILVELSELLSPSAGSDCSSGPAETACVEPFATLGLPFGDAANVAPQTVFKLAR